jgi:hypothetical protein
VPIHLLALRPRSITNTWAEFAYSIEPPNVRYRRDVGDGDFAFDVEPWLPDAVSENVVDQLRTKVAANLRKKLLGHF